MNKNYEEFLKDEECKDKSRLERVKERCENYLIEHPNVVVGGAWCAYGVGMAVILWQYTKYIRLHNAACRAVIRFADQA